MRDSVAVLLRKTTWKCGKIERLIINYLLLQLQRCGRIGIPMKEIILHFKFKGKQKSEFLDAVKRLEKRRILEIRSM